MATRLQIRSRARVRADQPGTFPTDAEYNDFIDDAAREVQYELIGAGWPIARSTASGSITSTGAARLVDDWGVTEAVAFIHGVYRIDGTTVTELRRLNEGDRASFGSTIGGTASHYEMTISPSDGPIVTVFPAQTGSYVVHYVAEFPGFTNDAASWYGPARSDEMIALKAAIKGMRKEGDDQGARELEREYAALYETVVRMASWFDMRNPPTIRDTGEQLTATRMPFDFDI